MKRVYNFNAGPSAMPLEVLKEVQDEFLDFNHTGMSIVEISHRSAAYQEMQDDTVATLKKLLAVPDDYHIVFIQGGGSMQFVMHAANFLKRRGGYLNTGVWSNKAMEAASFFGETYEVASSKADGFTYIPKADSFVVKADTDYIYMTSNNTIHGTEWHDFPSFDVPLFCDMSSDFLSRPVDVKNFDFIYAGVQKNVGPVAHWLDDHGGLAAIHERNKKKAAIVYGVIDDSQGFYRGHARVDSRSLMNVTFNLPTKELEAQFVAEAAEHDLIGVKGHRSVGGCRASIYNAVTEEGCQVLADFMKAFQKKH